MVVTPDSVDMGAIQDLVVMVVIRMLLELEDIRVLVGIRVTVDLEDTLQDILMQDQLIHHIHEVEVMDILAQFNPHFMVV